MAKTAIFSIIFLLLTSNVYPQKFSSKPGNVIGLGFAHYSVTTSWYYYDGVGIYKDRYPWHNFSRQLLFAFFDARSIFKLGRVNADLKTELQFGFLGDSQEDWITDNQETISDGGLTGALAVILKFSYPFKMSKTALLSPFGGLGFQFFYLYSNGEGVGTESSPDRYGYTYSWGEGIYGLIIDAGLAIEFKRIIISPEFRYFIVGGAFTDLDPRGDEVEQNNMPSYWGLLIGFGYEL